MLTRGEKFEYLFPVMALGYFGSIIVVAVAAFFLGGDLKDRLWFAALISGVMAIPWVPYFLWRWHLTRKSKERYARQQVFGDTDEFILST